MVARTRSAVILGRPHAALVEVAGNNTVTGTPQVFFQKKNLKAPGIEPGALNTIIPISHWMAADAGLLPNALKGSGSNGVFICEGQYESKYEG